MALFSKVTHPTRNAHLRREWKTHSNRDGPNTAQLGACSFFVLKVVTMVSLTDIKNKWGSVESFYEGLVPHCGGRYG